MSAAAIASKPTTAQRPLAQRLNKSTIVMLVVTLLVFIAFSVSAPTFLTVHNLENVAVQVSPTVIIGVAMTFVITTGMIDLSVGSILALVAVTGATLLRTGMQSVLVILICLAVGALCGLVNGWFSSYQKMPSFIVTLATMSIVRGIALLITLGYSIAIPSNLIFAQVGQGDLLGVGYPAWISLAVVVLGLLGLTRTRFGQYTTGVGSNEESVRRAGVNTNFIKMGTLTLSGLAAGLAGIITAGRLGSGDANTATDLALSVVTAVVIGGTNLLGGKGSIFGTAVGAILTGVITNGLTLLGLSPFIVPIVTGSLLVIVIWINLRGGSLTDFLRRRIAS
ncbi:ABC transporter permease [Raineyella sp. LH-20]|uniref:ABC transporter permease n=1 Tax=Raineyella sp. LH-20 TaxID=3081204 RepID=UPI0029558D46|nr:ABC transporter permease [Raineyella sp. LH-20]WOP18652.1 ABC transporter permease [Raineyella sp. LH-20]